MTRTWTVTIHIDDERREQRVPRTKKFRIQVPAETDTEAITLALLRTSDIRKQSRITSIEVG